MKAMVLADPVSLDSLQVATIPDPGAPGPGAIRVRVEASSLNYHDLLVATGRLGAPPGRIPLSDAAGIVEAVGDGVTEFAVGDRVVSCFFPDWAAGPPRCSDFRGTPGDGVDGFAAEVVVRPATAFTRAPLDYSAAEAATLTTAGVTAWRALVVDGALKAGDAVAVLGSGGVSVFALQLAVHMGATVYATSSSDAKIERLQALGAQAAINYIDTPDWGSRLQELTGRRGVDHIIEVGGPATLRQSIIASRIGGHIALIGVLTGREGNVPTALLMAKQVRLQGLLVGSRSDQQDLVRALDVSSLRPVIDSIWPFGCLAEAFRHEERGSHFGKIVIEGWD